MPLRRTPELKRLRKPESLWFGKYGKPVRGSIRQLLPPHSGVSIPSRIPGWWQPHKHDLENAVHVQRTSSRHAFPSRRNRLCRPGIVRFRGAALLPSLHHPCSILACPMLARSFPLPAAALLAFISIHRMIAIVFRRENILGGFPSTGGNASAPPHLFPYSLCNIHLLPTDSCK